MRKIVYILFLVLLSVNLYAQNIGGPIVRGVEPKEPAVLGDPKLLDPFNNPDEVDEPYIEDPDMTTRIAASISSPSYCMIPMVSIQ